MTPRAVCVTGAVAACLACGAEPGPPEVTLAITGQALIELDPRLIAETPFATVQPIIASADVAFTNGHLDKWHPRTFDKTEARLDGEVTRGREGAIL